MMRDILNRGLRYYLLGGADGFTPVACSLMEWAQSFEGLDRRRVDLTQINDSISVSTVFLGLEHGLDALGRPLLFETMIFDKGSNIGMGRCATWQEARAMHDSAVQRVRENGQKGLETWL